MNCEHSIPFLLSHSCQGLIAQDTGIRDQDVHTPELLERDFHDSIAVFHRAHRSYGFASRFNCDISIWAAKYATGYCTTHPS